jgi:large subunit ribosomal protein L32e
VIDMAEPKKSESNKPSEPKREEPKASAPKAAEPKAAPAPKPAPAAPKAEKPVAKTDKPAATKAEKPAAKPAGKAAKPAATSDVKIVDKPTIKKHVARPKATLTAEQREALALRKTIAGRRPWFRRQQWYEYKKLANSGWRKPTGIDSAMRRHFGYEQSVVRVGFAGPKSVRGLHSSGFMEVYVAKLEDLKAIDPKTQAARISGTLGARRLRPIYEQADKLGVRVLNRRNLPPAPKSGSPKPAAAAKPATTPKGGEKQ